MRTGCFFLLVLFLIGMASTVRGQNPYLELKYTPDTCGRKDLAFSIHTNLVIETIFGWDFGDPSSGTANISMAGSPTHVFTDTGTYTVSCILQINCSGPPDPLNPISAPCYYIDTVYTTVRITECDSIPKRCIVYIPNAFTPNGDGLNDTFSPSSSCSFERYELSVFNRWGQLVFRSKEPEEAWDGRLQDTECLQDVYVYQLDYKSLSQKGKRISGRLLLIR